MRTVSLSLPFTGRWVTQNSPNRRVPSHGVDVFGQRYAIDFVGVDASGRTTRVRDWRTVLATEPPERFVSFGRPILAPVDGVIVATHDGESDHAARRSQVALLPYALGQASRLRSGIDAVAGNRLIIQDRVSETFVALVHLRAGSLRVDVGDEVTTGQRVAECGNSGNSTQPHLHLHVMDGPDPSVARGIPFVFDGFQEWRQRESMPVIREFALPDDGSVIEP